MAIFINGKTEAHKTQVSNLIKVLFYVAELRLANISLCRSTM